MQKHETIKRILTIAFLATVAVLVSGCGQNLTSLSLGSNVGDNIKEVGVPLIMLGVPLRMLRIPLKLSTV